MTPLVSVIIPTRNRAALTLEAIASVRGQTYRDTEVIVVDDGSEDDTAEVVGKLDGITFLSQAHQGPAAARTRGLAAARGELVASLDSDDAWHPAFLERCVGALCAWDLDFVFANWVREPREPSYLDIEAAEGRLAPYCDDMRDGWALMTPDQLRAMFLNACPAPSSSHLLRRSSMPARWNDHMCVGDDWYLMLEMTVRRRSRAAFTLDWLWTKRFDGTNRYDALDPVEIVRLLYVHDLGQVRRDFAPQLTARERAVLAGRLAFWHGQLAYMKLRQGEATVR